MSKVSDGIRKSFEEGDSIRDAGLKTPETIMRYDNISYGENKQFQVLDVYRPKDRKGEKLPVIVSVHGGGWVYGDKERYQYYCMSLAERGFAVVNYTYRLAPEYQFPASLEDTSLVFDWMLNKAGTYGFDIQNVFAVGDSAGAHILSLFVAMCTSPDYANKYSFKVPENFKPNAIALNCGAYQITMGEESDDLTRMLMKELLPEKGSDEELELISSINYITTDYVPCFVMTCVDDFLKDQAPIFVEKLAECEIPFLYRMYGDSKNRLSHVFHCDMRLEDAAKCNDDECAFFRQYLKKK